MRLGRELRRLSTSAAVGAATGGTAGIISENDSFIGGMTKGAMGGLAGGLIGGRFSSMANMNMSRKMNRLAMAGERSFDTASAAFTGAGGLFGGVRRTLAANRMINSLDQVRKGRAMSRLYKMRAGKPGIGATVLGAGAGAGAMTYAMLKSNGGPGSPGFHRASLDERFEYEQRRARMLAEIDIAKAKAKASIWQNR